jgi:hypothetical protein
MPRVDLGVGQRRDLRLAEGGADVGGDLLLIDALCARPLAGAIVLFEPPAEIGNGGSGAQLFLLAKRITAAVNLALELPCLLARSHNAPVRE